MSDYKELIERARDPESWKHGHIWALCEELIDALESACDHQDKLIADAVAQERERCVKIGNAPLKPNDVEWFASDLSSIYSDMHEYTRTDAIMSDPRVKALVECGSRIADCLENGVLSSDAVTQWDNALAAIKENNS